MKPFFTIGVYLKTEEEFFELLRYNNIEVFCDVRNRRGMRGGKYSFVNSKYLQKKLDDLKICYQHIKELAPNKEIRREQKANDKTLGINKRERTELSENFRRAYAEKVMLKFDFSVFKTTLFLGEKNIVLFCVEGDPNACHRSIIAQKLIDLNPGIEIINL